MDHADWAMGNINAAKRLAKSHPKNKEYQRYLKAPAELNEFQKCVMDIVGMVGNGIYNAPIAHDCIDWQHGRDGVSMTWRGDLSTFDFDGLTRLVFLCHEARIRLSIDPAGPKLLRLSFWPRKAEGPWHARHPNLDEAVARFREYLPIDHRIIYQAIEAEKAEA
jgi:hypothetical protein